MCICLSAVFCQCHLRLGARNLPSDHRKAIVCKLSDSYVVARPWREATQHRAHPLLRGAPVTRRRGYFRCELHPGWWHPGPVESEIGMYSSRHSALTAGTNVSHPRTEIEIGIPSSSDRLGVPGEVPARVPVSSQLMAFNPKISRADPRSALTNPSVGRSLTSGLVHCWRPS